MQDEVAGMSAATNRAAILQPSVVFVDVPLPMWWL